MRCLWLRFDYSKLNILDALPTTSTILRATYCLEAWSSGCRKSLGSSRRPWLIGSGTLEAADGTLHPCDSCVQGNPGFQCVK